MKIEQKERVPQKNSRSDPYAIFKKLDELILMVHGSFDSQEKLSHDFHVQNPECSKYSVCQKIKEFFIRVKRNDDSKYGYFIKDEVLNLLKNRFPDGLGNKELVAVMKARQAAAHEEIRFARLKKLQEKLNTKLNS